MNGSINTPGVSYKQLWDLLKGGLVDIIATRLLHARKISLIGDVSGSTAFDGSKDVEIPVTIKKDEVIAETGAITVTLEDNREYSFTNVTSLEMNCPTVNAHGFVTFGSSVSTPVINGVTASKGDDIKEAAAGEKWEFSVWPDNGGNFIIWAKWSE